MHELQLFKEWGVVQGPPGWLFNFDAQCPQGTSLARHKVYYFMMPMGRPLPHGMALGNICKEAAHKGKKKKKKRIVYPLMPCMLVDNVCVWGRGEAQVGLSNLPWQNKDLREISVESKG